MADLTTITRAIYDAFGRGDIPGILQHLADDVAWESWADNQAQKAGVPWMKSRRGKAGAAEFFGVVAIQDHTSSRIMPRNQVAAEFTIEATVPSGKRYRDEDMHLETFNDAGKVVRLRHYTDTAKHIAVA